MMLDGVTSIFNNMIRVNMLLNMLCFYPFENSTLALEGKNTKFARTTSNGVKCFQERMNSFVDFRERKRREKVQKVCLERGEPRELMHHFH